MNDSDSSTTQQRRHIRNVAGGYAVIAWSLIQIATQLCAVFDLPPCALRWMVVLLVFVGFPIAVLLAWICDFTSGGREGAASIRPNEWSRAVLAIGLVAAGMVALREVHSIDEPREAAKTSRAACHHAG